MGDVCTDGRFDLIERFKRDLVEATNIETSPEEMAVLDSILFRMWQMGWLDRLEQPAASPWRRVEDELPEIGKRVLVSYGGDVQILKRTDSMTYDGKNYWWNEADGLWERVEEGSYWMPIEPPKEETK